MSDEVNDLIAAIEPYRDALARIVALLERLSARVDLLELEQTWRLPPSAVPSASSDHDTDYDLTRIQH